MTRSGTRANPSNEDTAGATLVCKAVLNDQQLRRINSLAYTTDRRTDFAREGKQLSSFESFDHAAGSRDYKGFSEKSNGRKIPNPNHFQDAIQSPQRKQ